jgi:hypothetical protein
VNLFFDIIFFLCYKFFLLPKEFFNQDTGQALDKISASLEKGESDA